MKNNPSPFFSILIPAHNEEKNIGRVLKNLGKIAGKETEILVGLDRCQDGTEKIVRLFKTVRVVKNKTVNGGKPYILDKLITASKGKAIIVHDADWRLIATAKGMQELKKTFLKKTGGIVLPPHNMPFLSYLDRPQTPTYRQAAVGLYWFNRFLISRQTKKIAKDRYFVEKEKIIYPFTVNIFLKKYLKKKAKTTADDFERFYNLVENGKTVEVWDSPRWPHFLIEEPNFNFYQHFKRRKRGQYAREQIKRKINYLSVLPGFLSFCLKNFRRIGLAGFWQIVLWLGITLMASLWGKLEVIIRGTPTAAKAWEIRDRA